MNTYEVRYVDGTQAFVTANTGREAALRARDHANKTVLNVRCTSWGAPRGETVGVAAS